MVKDIIVQFLVELVRLLATIVFSAAALYSGINIIDRFTAAIDEWKEIKKGNVAVGLFFASVMLAFVLLTASRIVQLVFLIDVPFDLTMFALSFLNYLLAILFAAAAIFLTIHVIDYLTEDLNEMAELKKGNVAISLIMSLVLLVIAFLLSLSFEELFMNIIQLELSLI